MKKNKINNFKKIDINIIDKYDKLKKYDKKELKKGILIEHEHLINNKKYSQKDKNEIAKYIAKAHIYEHDDYYKRLEFAENNKFVYFKIGDEKHNNIVKVIYLYCLKIQNNKWLFISAESKKEINKYVPVYKFDLSYIDLSNNYIEQGEKRPNIQIYFNQNIFYFPFFKKLEKHLSYRNKMSKLNKKS